MGQEGVGIAFKLCPVVLPIKPNTILKSLEMCRCVHDYPPTLFVVQTFTQEVSTV